MKHVSIKGKTPEGLGHDGAAVAHVVALLQAIDLPEEPKKLVAEAEAPNAAEIETVLTKLSRDPHDISALGRKLPTFDTDDLT